MKKPAPVKNDVAIETKPNQKVIVVVEAQKIGQPLVTVFSGFTSFLREQGIISLAIAVVLGAAVTKLVGALVADIINPVIGVMVGAAGDLASMSLSVGPIEILWGHFLATVIDFVIIAGVIYLLVKLLKLDRLDKKKT